MTNETDALSGFDLNKLGGGGLYLKFLAGSDVTLRFLTVDPIVQTVEYTNKDTGEKEPGTKFAFIVYNLTDNAAQIVELSPGLMKRIVGFHKDPDFGADLRKMDVKIKPSGEGLERRYDVQVLRHSGSETKLTTEQVKAAASINLEEKVQGGYRLSKWDEMQKKKNADPTPADLPDAFKDADAPIDMDSIPF